MMSFCVELGNQGIRVELHISIRRGYAFVEESGDGVGDDVVSTDAKECDGVGDECSGESFVRP